MSSVLKNLADTISNEPEYDQYTLDEIVDQIIGINEKQAKFWRNAFGWAPEEASQLMNQSRLDRQISLSHCLKIWIKDKCLEKEEGALILAWANLGSLVEGTMKLFLCVHLEDYKNDPAAEKKKGKILNPDGFTLGQLHKFFQKNNLLPDNFMIFIKNVQNYRNNIHAFENKPIGSIEEFYAALKKYLEMIEDVDTGLPYPWDIL